MSKRKAQLKANVQRPPTRLREFEPFVDTDTSLAYPSRQAPAAVKPVPFQQPTSLLTFSYTPSRELVWDDSSMRYYVDPPPGAELGYGYERWVKRPSEKGRIDSLLRAWVKAREKFGGIPGIDVVSWRGVMTKILIAPYEDRDGWDLNVMCINGTLYFEEHISDARLEDEDNMNPRQRLQTYYGYAFESWCTSSHLDRPERAPDRLPGWGGDVETNVQWCNVVKSKLGDIRIVIGGEVDCIRGDRKDAFVELKTSLAIRDQRDEARFEKKLLKFYFQSFLLAVPEIIVGFRTAAGRLTTTQSFKTIQLPRLVRGKPGAWDPQLCLDWGARFLAFLKGVVQATSEESETKTNKGSGTKAGGKSGTTADGGYEPKTDLGSEEWTKPKVWRVRFAPGKGVSLRLLGEEEVREVEAGEERVGFLPTWFWEGERERGGEGREEKGASMIPEPEKLGGAPTMASGTSRKELPPGWTI